MADAGGVESVGDTGDVDDVGGCASAPSSPPFKSVLVRSVLPPDPVLPAPAIGLVVPLAPLVPLGPLGPRAKLRLS